MDDSRLHCISFRCLSDESIFKSKIAIFKPKMLQWKAWILTEDLSTLTWGTDLKTPTWGLPTWGLIQILNSNYNYNFWIPIPITISEFQFQLQILNSNYEFQFRLEDSALRTPTWGFIQSLNSNSKLWIPIMNSNSDLKTPTWRLQLEDLF